jgi:hypothetical protein
MKTQVRCSLVLKVRYPKPSTREEVSTVWEAVPLATARTYFRRYHALMKGWVARDGVRRRLILTATVTRK